jgi:MoxR-like ATPase
MLTDPLFTPARTAEWTPTKTEVEERVSYLFRDERIELAVNVAMATKRPLLVTGPPGAGKSSLARAVASAKQWTYIERVVNSRTELRDLTAGFDAVRRLADAQVKDRLLPDWAYLVPGVLWWAFDPESAARRGHRIDELTVAQRPSLPSVPDPREKGQAPGVVLLLDEIDKAEPDLANDLLGPLDGFSFPVAGVDGPISAPDEMSVFVVITSNRERLLPPAFLRRCVQLELRLGSADHTVADPAVIDFFAAVAAARFGSRDGTLYRDVAEKAETARRAALVRNRREPSTAEYLDTVRACLRFDLTPESAEWRTIAETALWKSPDVPDEVVRVAVAG